MKRAGVGISIAAAFAAGSLAFRPTPLEAKRVEGVAIFGVYHQFLADGGCSTRAHHDKPPTKGERDVLPREHWLLSPGECAIEKGRAGVATATDYGVK